MELSKIIRLGRVGELCAPGLPTICRFDKPLTSAPTPTPTPTPTPPTPTPTAPILIHKFPCVWDNFSEEYGRVWLSLSCRCCCHCCCRCYHCAVVFCHHILLLIFLGPF